MLGVMEEYWDHFRNCGFQIPLCFSLFLIQMPSIFSLSLNWISLQVCFQCGNSNSFAFTLGGRSCSFPEIVKWCLDVLQPRVSDWHAFATCFFLLNLNPQPSQFHYFGSVDGILINKQRFFFVAVFLLNLLEWMGAF